MNWKLHDGDWFLGNKDVGASVFFDEGKWVGNALTFDKIQHISGKETADEAKAAVEILLLEQCKSFDVAVPETEVPDYKADQL